MNLRFFSLASSSLLAVALVGCSPMAPKNSTAADAKAFAAPSGLAARLADPDVHLDWTHNASEPGGYWIEWATPGDDFVKLDVAWSHAPRFRHPQVAPNTEHLYRVVPFFGKTSEVVEIVTGANPSEELMRSEVEGPLEMESLTALGLVPLNAEGIPSREAVAKSPAESRKSLKSIATAGDATPSGLTAALSLPINVVLRWTDRAADEDGYLVEFSKDPQKDFAVCALLPPDTVSFRKILLSPDTKYYFRVRPFFYGEPSSVASAVVGQPSTLHAARE